MGDGSMYFCKKCQKEFDVFLGTGLGFPMVYSELVQSIKKGEYGQEFKNIVSSNKFIAINASKELYLCKHCGNWNVDFVLDLYEPKDIEKLKKQKYSNWSVDGVFDTYISPESETELIRPTTEQTIEELGFLPSVLPWELEEEYKLIKRYVHNCSKCGETMDQVKDEDSVELHCPECGKKLQKTLSAILWD